MPQASPSRPAPTALAWLIGFVLSSAPLGATQPVEVLVSTAGPGTPETKVECTLRAVNGENTLEWTIKAPWSGVLEVPVEQAWKFSVEAPGFWAAETTLDVAAGTHRLEIGLHPAGAISGKLQTPEAAEPPPTLLLELASPPARQAERNSTSSPIEVPCPVSKGFFICKLPAGRLDLKLQVSGYAPRYLWATEVATGETTDLGTLHLQRGGSVIGWVEVAGPTDEGDTPVVVLEPPVMGWKLDPRDASRQALRAASTRADERGFFQLTGLAPGGYQLVAKKPGFAMPEPLLIEVDADRETLLEEPVTLQTLRSLEIYIEPTTTPTGARWQIEMSRERATLPVLDVVAKGTASAAGFWRSQELALGKYRLSVNDPAGSSWLEQEIELETTGPPHQIEIPLIPIKGRVTLGKEPIRAIVSFGTTQGRPEIRLETNDDGELEGYLPREGEWPVELIMGEHDAVAQAIEPVFVEKPRGSEPADVDIELPNTELTGIVVENGAPVAGAGVVVIRYDAAKKRREAMLQTDEEGKFKLRGLSEGMLDLQARSVEKTSAWVRAHLQEDLENQPLVLELATKTKVVGQVLSPAGPVAGANLVALPGGTPTGFALSVEAVTAADGTFTLETTADTRWLDVIVVPAGLPIRLDRLTVDKERKTPIVLQLGAQGGDLLVAEMPNAPDPQVTLEPLKIIHGATEVDVRWLLKVLGHRRSRLDEQGIALFGLEAGEYSLCRAPRGDCTTGFLAAAGQLALVTPSNLGNLESFRQLMETRR